MEIVREEPEWEWALEVVDEKTVRCVKKFKSSPKPTPQELFAGDLFPGLYGWYKMQDQAIANGRSPFP